MNTDTKTELLDVAEHAVRARGFDGFSYADLAEAVGIRKASIHYHFPTKALLSAALIDRYYEDLKAVRSRIEKKHKKASNRLLAIIEFYREALNEGKTLCLCVSLIMSRESLSEEVLKKIENFRAMMVRWMEGVFKLSLADQSIDGVINPAHEARATLALLEGAHLSARASEDVALFDQAVETLKARCS